MSFFKVCLKNVFESSRIAFVVCFLGVSISNWPILSDGCFRWGQNFLNFSLIYRFERDLPCHSLYHNETVYKKATVCYEKHITGRLCYGFLGPNLEIEKKSCRGKIKVVKPEHFPHVQQAIIQHGFKKWKNAESAQRFINHIQKSRGILTITDFKKVEVHIENFLTIRVKSINLGWEKKIFLLKVNFQSKLWLLKRCLQVADSSLRICRLNASGTSCHKSSRISHLISGILRKCWTPTRFRSGEDLPWSIIGLLFTHIYFNTFNFRAGLLFFNCLKCDHRVIREDLSWDLEGRAVWISL